MKKAYKSKWIITSAIQGQQIYEDYAIVVDEGKIIDILPQNDLVEDDYKKVEDYENSIITAGFVNLGTQLQYTDIFKVQNHSFSSNIKRVFQNIHKFFSMLGTPVNSYPMLLANVQKEYYCFDKQKKIESFMNGVQQSLLNGVTCIAQISKEDKYFELLNDLPVKTYLFYELFADSSKKSKQEFRKIRNKVEKILKNKSDDTFIGFYPNSITNVHKKLWRILSKYSRKMNLLLMTELVESGEEADWLEFGKSDIDLYNSFLGLRKMKPNQTPNSAVKILDNMNVFSKNVIVRNGNYLDEKELELLAQKGVQFAYSPKFNDEHFEKKYNFSTLLKYFPQKIGYSTGFLNTKDFNMLDELCTQEVLLPIEELIKYITIYPAQILRLDNIIGSIEIGKHADFNVFKLNKRENFNNLRENNIPYAVFSKGKKLVDNHEVINIKKDK